MCMDEEIYTGIGKLIGKVQEMDTYRTVDCMGQVIRMIILVDITKPLKKVLFIETEDGKKFQLQWSMRNCQIFVTFVDDLDIHTKNMLSTRAIKKGS